MATQAKVIIKGENNLTKAVKSASSDLSGLKGAADKLGSTIKGAFTVTAIIAGVKALGNAVKDCVSSWTVQEQAYVSLDAVMGNIGKSTGMTTKQLADMASSLQTVTTFGDETIQSAEQILVATGKLNSENLPRAIELSLDMATALGTDAAGGAQKLALALQDPATGLRTLRQANITFSASEKETINTLLASGKTFDAQNLILDKVAGAYGGLAQKGAATPTGKITQINNLIGDVKEGLGEGIVMALEPVFDWLIERLSEICRTINDLNADTRLRSDFEAGGASLVGTKYSPDTIVSSMGKLNDEMRIYENQLMDLLTAEQPWNQRKSYRDTKASQDLRTMGASGWMAWDQMPEHSGSESGYQAYLQWKSLSDMLIKMGSALSISQNYDAKSGVDAFHGNDVVADDDSDEETLVSTLDGFLKSYGSRSASKGLSELKSAIEEATSWKATATGDQLTWLDEIIASLQKELEPVSNLGSIDDFLKSYGSKSESMGKADIRNAIDEATEWKKTATGDQGTWLDEIIATLQEELSPVTESALDLEDFLSSNKNLSVTAQVEEIQDRIDTALSFDTEKATEEQKEVLDEIVASSEEAIKKLTGSTEKVILSFTTAIGTVRDSWTAMSSTGNVDAGILDDLSASVGKLLEAVKPLVQIFFSSNPLLAVLIPIIEGLVDVLAPALTTVISPIMDALRWIGSSLAGVFLPILDAIYPIMAVIGAILTTAVAPVLQLLSPVIELVALVFSALTPVIALVGQALTILISPIQFVADLFSWLGRWLSYLGDCVGTCAWNLTHWFDQRSYGSSPDAFTSDAFTGLGEKLAAWESYGVSNTAVSDSVSTGTAVSSASYQGATQVTINIYQEAPVVGEGGMRAFAKMIKTEFDELEYYGVAT